MGIALASQQEFRQVERHQPKNRPFQNSVGNEGRIWKQVRVGYFSKLQADPMRSIYQEPESPSHGVNSCQACLDKRREIDR
ncbi:MAG TPA: hypothetical protein VNN73_14125, partial [Blastocatellia bacterium]|nr:hypothetical protein [Blastocatellia bacterium]